MCFCPCEWPGLSFDRFRRKGAAGDVSGSLQEFLVFVSPGTAPPPSERANCTIGHMGAISGGVRAGALHQDRSTSLGLILRPPVAGWLSGAHVGQRDGVGSVWDGASPPLRPQVALVLVLTKAQSDSFGK